MTEPRQIPREEIMQGIGKAVHNAIAEMEGGGEVMLDLVDVTECLVTLAGDSLQEFIPMDARLPILLEMIQCLRQAAGINNEEVMRFAAMQARARNPRDTH